MLTILISHILPSISARGKRGVKLDSNSHRIFEKVIHAIMSRQNCQLRFRVKHKLKTILHYRPDEE